MKKINFIIIEIVITVSLIGILLLLVTPFGKSMMSTMYMIFGAGAAAWLIIFTLFFLKDPSDDERDRVHIKYASRIAFIIGVAILMIGTYVQSLSGDLDILLPIALSAMLVSKTLGIIYKRVTD